MAGKDEILVGVDGSRDSAAAVIWAAGEAASRGCGLMLVHAFDTSSVGIWTVTASIRSGLRELSKWVVDDALLLAAKHQPGVAARGRVLFGSPTRVLLLLSRSVQLTVVGRNGRGALTNLWLGSITQRVLAHASSPAIAVRGGPDPTTLGTVSRIVVGMDAGPAEESVLGFAFSAAQRRGVPLEALHVVPHPVSPSGVVMDGPGSEHGVAEERQAKALSAWFAAYPSVQVASVVRSGQVGDVFGAECHPNDLLVLGHHRHAPFLPHQLGRTAAAALHDARCPVAVVHEPAANLSGRLDVSHSEYEGEQ